MADSFKRIILITGSTDGIGRQTALELAAHHVCFILVKASINLAFNQITSYFFEQGAVEEYSSFNLCIFSPPSYFFFYYSSSTFHFFFFKFSKRLHEKSQNILQKTNFVIIHGRNAKKCEAAIDYIIKENKLENRSNLDYVVADFSDLYEVIFFIRSLIYLNYFWFLYKFLYIFPDLTGC